MMRSISCDMRDEVEKWGQGPLVAYRGIYVNGWVCAIQILSSDTNHGRSAACLIGVERSSHVSTTAPCFGLCRVVPVSPASLEQAVEGLGEYPSRIIRHKGYHA
jgi:hypothetical protein